MHRVERGNAFGVWSAAVAILCLAGVARGDDWPFYGGPNRNGISAERDWKAWTGAPKVAWTSALGPGYSSVVVAADRVFTAGGGDVVRCLNAADGATVWTFPENGRGKGKHTQGTPAVGGGRVYYLAMTGDLLCLDAATGRKQWSKSLPSEFGVKWGGWGPASSPLVVGEKLILDVGKILVLDRNTGALILQAGTDTASYATPAVFTLRGQPHVTAFSAKALAVYNLETGKEVARHPWVTDWDVNAATPIVSDGKVFISSGYRHGCALLDLTPEGAKVVYENKDMANQCQSSVLYEGHVYGVHGQQGSRGSLKCLEFATGQTKWEEKNLPVGGGLTLANGKLIVLADGGELLVAEASSAKFGALARGKVLQGKCWTVPVLSGGRIFCRSFDGALACVDVR